MTNTAKIYQERDNVASHSYTIHDSAGIGRESFKGNLTFKRSASGMTTTAYLHFFFTPIAKGVAKGGGYDCHSAAFIDALKNLVAQLPAGSDDAIWYAALLGKCDGSTEWQQLLRDAGFYTAHIGG
jgi:hypothetical protein